MASYINTDNLIKEKHLFNFNRSYNTKPNFLFDNRYDEPTYLTFRIDFFPTVNWQWHGDHMNGLYENDIKLSSYDDMPQPLLDLKNDYSTYTYLKDSIGDEYRANLLFKFVKGLADLTWNCPFYIQEMDGLNDLLIVDPKRGTRVDQEQVLTLKCLDSLDQRILGLMNMYKKVAWDDVYQRWILPDMMRYFKMRIYISEFRFFHSGPDNMKSAASSQIEYSKLSNNGKYSTVNSLKTLTDKISQITGKDQVITEKTWALLDNNINDKMPTICLECNMCEFDISDIYSHLGSLSAADPRTYSGQPEIKIKIGNVKEILNYKILNIDFINSRLGGKPTNGIISDKELQKGRLGDNGSRYIADIDSHNTYYYDSSNFYDVDSISRYDRTNIKDEKSEVTTRYSNVIEDRARSFIGNVIKNSAETAVAWADNKANYYLNDVLNDRLLGGLSINDALNGAASGNIFSMYNTFAIKSKAMQELYPEVSGATKDGLEIAIFENILEELSLSEATNDSEQKMKDLAETFLEYGKANNFKTTDEYMNALFEAIRNINN